MGFLLSRNQDGTIALQFRDANGDWGKVSLHPKPQLDAYIDITNDTALRECTTLNQADIIRLRSRATRDEHRTKEQHNRPPSMHAFLILYCNVHVRPHINKALE